MSEFDHTETTADSAAPPPRKSTAKIVIWILVGLGLLSLTCAGGVVWLLLGSKADVQPAADAFLDAIDARDYVLAYKYVGPEWKQKDDLAGFTKLEKRFRQILGAAVNRSLSSFNVKRGTGGSVAVFTYSVEFANGAAEETLTLTDVSGEWKVVGQHIDSPLLVESLTCSKCGAENAMGAKFCGQCGEPM
jgi:hypothetical protein